MNIICCKECHKQGNSYIGCHSKCEKYLKEKEQWMEVLDKQQKDHFIDNTIRNLYIHRKKHKK